MKNTLLVIAVLLVGGCSEDKPGGFLGPMDLSGLDTGDWFPNLDRMGEAFYDLNGTWFERVNPSNSTGSDLRTEDVAGAYYFVKGDYSREDNTTAVFVVDGTVRAYDETGAINIFDGLKWAIKDGVVLFEEEALENGVDGNYTHTFKVEPNGDLSILELQLESGTINYEGNNATYLPRTNEAK